MRLVRPVFLPVALFLLLALPASADARTAPALEGPPSSAIEGTITSLNIPFVDGGPIVTLLDGLVSFDATGATVRFSNGTSGTTVDLEIGQRIVAFVEPAPTMPKARSIVVLAQKFDVTLTGRVDAVDPAARTLTVLGFVAKVTDRTVFGGPRDGAGQAGLEDVRAGELVLVAAMADSGTLVANRVMKLSPSPLPTSRVRGLVDSIGTESWTLVLRDGTKTVVKVDAETKVVGNPKVRDEVDVLVRQLPDGSLLALLIAKAPITPPVATEVAFEGIVARIAADGPLGTATWLVGETKVLVSPVTTVRGEPGIGDRVRVEGFRGRDGVVMASRIAKL